MGVTNYLGNLGGEGGGGGSASIAFTYVGNGGPSIVVPIPGALSTPIQYASVINPAGLSGFHTNATWAAFSSWQAVAGGPPTFAGTSDPFLANPGSLTFDGGAAVLLNQIGVIYHVAVMY
jgi:hypothetical protein